MNQPQLLLRLRCRAVFGSSNLPHIIMGYKMQIQHHLGMGLLLAMAVTVGGNWVNGQKVAEKAAVTALSDGDCGKAYDVTNMFGQAARYEITQCAVKQHPTNPNSTCVEISYMRPNWQGPAKARGCTRT